MVSTDRITSILEKLAEIGVELENLDKDSQREEYENEEIQQIELKFVDKFEQELRKYWLGDDGIQDLVLLARSIITGEKVSNIQTIAILPKNRPDLCNGQVKEEKELEEQVEAGKEDQNASKKKRRDSLHNVPSNRLEKPENTDTYIPSPHSVLITADISSQKEQKKPNVSTVVATTTIVEETKENSRQNLQSPKSHEKKEKTTEVDVVLDKMEQLPSPSTKSTNSARREMIHLEVDQKRSKFPAWSIWRWREDKLDWLEGDQMLIGFLRDSWNPEIFQLLNYWEPPLQGQGLLRSPLRTKALSARNAFVKKLVEKWGFKKTLYKLTPQRTKGMFWFGIGATRLDQMTFQERKHHLAEYTQPIPSACRQNHVSNLLDLIEKMAGTTLNNKSLSDIILKRIIREDQVPCKDPILEELWQKKRLQNPWKFFFDSNYAKSLSELGDRDEIKDTEKEEKKDDYQVKNIVSERSPIDGNIGMKKRRGRPPLKRKLSEKMSTQNQKNNKQLQKTTTAICDASANIITIN